MEKKRLGSKPKHRTTRPKMAGTKEILAQNVERNLSAEISTIEFFRALNSARNTSLRTFSAGIFWGGGGALRICTILLIHSHPETVARHQHMWLVLWWVLTVLLLQARPTSVFGREAEVVHSYSRKGKSFGLFWMLVCIICMPR